MHEENIIKNKIARSFCMFALSYGKKQNAPSQSPMPYTGNKFCIYEKLKIMMPFHTL